MSDGAPVRYRFDAFVVDLRTGELTRDGRRVPLAWQSAQLLRLLASRPGDFVTRDEVRRALWPDDTHVDYDHGLNNAVARLRRALGDSAETPRFVETLPRVGYRLIRPSDTATDADGAAASDHRSPTAVPWRRWALAAAVFAAGIALGTMMPRPLSNQARPQIAAAGEARDQAERSLAYTRLVLAGDLDAGVASAAASDASTRALALDPTLAEAHLAAGYTAMWARWEWSAADRFFATARDLAPRSSRVHQAQAFWLSAQGRHQEALHSIGVAMDLDPASAEIARLGARLAFVSGDRELAVRRLRGLLDRHPNDVGAHELLSQVLASLGRNAEAAPHLARFLVLVGVDERFATDDARRLADGGMDGLHRWYLSRPSTKPANRYGVPFKMASNYIAAGDLTSALEWLQRACAQRDSRLLFLKVDPRFDRLRGDPRFQRLVEQVGL